MIGRVLLVCVALAMVLPAQANIIDGTDDRGALTELGPALGLSKDEIARIRRVSGYVGCLSPSPSVGSAALFLANDQILTAAHILVEASGKRRSKCFFRAQLPDAPRIDLLLDEGHVIIGAATPKAGSNDDFAVVKLAAPVKGAEPFPVTNVPVKAGDRLIAITAHPAGMEKVPNDIPVVQACTVRRVPKSSGRTNFYRSDCDATGASSGGMNLARVGGKLVWRGIFITTGPWRDPKFFGAPYNEAKGSVTTSLATDAAVLAAGKRLAGE